MCGHVSTVKAMLKAGGPVDVVTSSGGTVLHFAAQGGSMEMIREVLSAGCNINKTTTIGGTPLHLAAEQGKTEAVLELIRHGANRSIVAGTAGTPLHQAAIYCHIATLKAMIEEGCPVDVVDRNDATVLHFAAQGGSVEVIRELLGAGNTETALELIRCGANRVAVAGTWGTPRHCDALHGHVSTVKAMIKAVCLVDVLHSHDATVLHYAALGDSVEVIREVLSIYRV